MDGLKNFLRLINDNWTTIVVIIGLGISVYHKIRQYLALSQEEKVLIAKNQIREIVLKLVTDAELDYGEWKKAGQIKRAQVIEEIFKQYPILQKVIDQKDLYAFLDGIIDDALLQLKSVTEENSDEK